MAAVLVVDDEPTLLNVFGRVLEQAGHRVLLAQTGEAALNILMVSEPDVLVVDVRLADGNGLDIAARARAQWPNLRSIVITGYPDYEAARRGYALGVVSWLHKPFDNQRLVESIDAALSGAPPVPQSAPHELVAPPPEHFEGLVGKSTAMLAVYQRIARVAAADATVLIQGESGTGKELVAQSIHRRSVRASRAFVTVNVAAVPDSLFEDQLFGHEAGAFTDARTTVPGLLDRANGGVLFFDEIGELPLSSQAKLLRVLEDRQFYRLGGHRAIPLDVRVVAATNRDLEAAVDVKVFRADLYHRLARFTVSLPPLHMRKGDIPMLIDYWLPRIAVDFGGHPELTPVARDLLERYTFPGNVRELQNVLFEACAAAPWGPSIDDAHLPDRVRRPKGQAASGCPDFPRSIMPLAEATAQVERTLIPAAVAHCGGNREAAARLLGIDSKTLRRKLADMRLADPRSE